MSQDTLKVHKGIDEREYSLQLGDPASERQIEVLQELGISYPEDVTYGLAGFLLRQEIEERKELEREYRESHPIQYPTPRFVREARLERDTTKPKTRICKVCGTVSPINKPCFRCGSTVPGKCLVCGVTTNFKYRDIGLCDDCISNHDIRPVVLLKRFKYGIKPVDESCGYCLRFNGSKECKSGYQLLYPKDCGKLHLSGLAVEVINKDRNEYRVAVCLSERSPCSSIKPCKGFARKDDPYYHLFFRWESKSFLGWVDRRDLQ